MNAPDARELRCARCGAHPLVEAVLADDGYICVVCAGPPCAYCGRVVEFEAVAVPTGYACLACATCSRCHVLSRDTFLVAAGTRACAGCLTLSEQRAVGHDEHATLPEAG